MNLDKPLEELIADKRTTSAPRGGGGGGGGATRGRVSRDRAGAVPYARPAPRSTGDTWVHDAYSGPGARRGGFGGGGGGARGFPPASAGGVGFTGISPRIQVSGLHYEVTPADLKNIFSQAGTIVQGPTILNAYYLFLLIITTYDVSGRSTGVANMEYAAVQQAKLAINKFDGAMTKGQTITIKFLPPNIVRPAPGAFGPGAGARPAAQTGAALLSRIAGAGPASGAVRGGGAARGGAAVARGRGGSARGRSAPAAGAGRGGRGGAAAAAVSKSAPNAGNLDDELDAFMKVDATGDVAMA